MRARKLIYPLLLVLATPLNVLSQFAFRQCYMLYYILLIIIIY